MSYKGLIAEIPIGQLGLTGNRNQPVLDPRLLTVGKNITYENGTLQKEPGAVKYNSTALQSSGGNSVQVIQGFDWWPTPTAQRMIVALSDGTVRKDSGAGTFPTTIKSGLTIGSYVGLVEGGAESAGADKKLFIFTGSDVVQVLTADGAATTNLATPPADWATTNQPVAGVIHEGRLWGFGNANDRHRIYYSTPSAHENFTGTGSGSISVFPGEGDGISAAMSYRGLLVVLKKPRGLYFIDTADANFANWRVARASGEIGVFSQGCIVPLENDLGLIDTAGGIQLLSTIQEPGSLASRNFAEPNYIDRIIREEMNFSDGSSKIRVIYYPLKRQFHLGIASAGMDVNDRRIVLDSSRGQNLFSISTRDNPVSMWLRRDGAVQRLMMGDNQGFVWELDQDTRSKDGSGYEGRFQSVSTDLSFLNPEMATKWKNADFLELVMEPTGDHNLTVALFWDGRQRQVVSFNLGAVGTALGEFILGSTALGSTRVVHRKKRITGGGRRIAIAGYNEGAAQDFSIARFLLYFRPGDESLREG